MRDHVCEILGTVDGERLHPFGHAPVRVRPASARNLSVRDVPHEHMAKDVGGLAGNRGAPFSAHELLPLERVQPTLDLGAIEIERSRDRADPEDLADDGSGLDQCLLVGRERVEPRGDDPLDRLGKRQLRLSAWREHPHVLLRIEWIAAGASQKLCAALRAEGPVRQKGRQEQTGLRIGERRERDRRRVALAASPPGAAIEKLGSSRTDQHERNAARPIRHVVDEVEQIVVGPVEILEDEDERIRLGDRLEESPPGGERLAPAVCARLASPAQPRQRPQVTFDPPSLHLVGDHPIDRGAELCFGRLRVVALKHSCVGLRHLAERPVCDSLAVGKRATLAPGDEDARVRVQSLVELPHQSALADSGNADECDQLWGAGACRARKRIAERCELGVSPDERGAAAERNVDAEARDACHGLPRPHRLRLSLGLNRSDLAILDEMLARPARGVVDEDPVDRRGRLQARSCIDDVTRCDAFALLRAGVEADERLARGDGDANVQLEARVVRVHVRNRVADCKRGEHGARRVVLVGQGRAEDRYDRIADELLDRSAVVLDLLPHAGVVRESAARRHPRDRAALRGS